MRLRIYYRWTVTLKIRNGKTKPIRAKTYTNLWRHRTLLR